MSSAISKKTNSKLCFSKGKEKTLFRQTGSTLSRWKTLIWSQVRAVVFTRQVNRVFMIANSGRVQKLIVVQKTNKRSHFLGQKRIQASGCCGRGREKILMRCMSAFHGPFCASVWLTLILFSLTPAHHAVSTATVSTTTSTLFSTLTTQMYIPRKVKATDQQQQSSRSWRSAQLPLESFRIACSRFVRFNALRAHHDKLSWLNKTNDSFSVGRSSSQKSPFSIHTKNW